MDSSPHPRGNLQKHRSGNPLQQLLIRRFQGRIEAILAGLPKDRLLDAGCGEGFVLQRLVAGRAGGSGSKWHLPFVDSPPGGEGFVLRELAWPRSRENGLPGIPSICLYGVDTDQEALRYARRLIPGPHLARASVLDLPFPDRSFPVVLCLEVLEHLPEPERAVTELRRVAGGHLVASVPHEPWFRLANLARGKNLRRWGDDVEHLNHWGPGGFRRLLETGFGRVRLSAAFPWLIAVAEA